MEIKAKLNYLRIAPRKVRLVAKLIKKMDVGRAELELQHTPKRVARPILKLLKSAVAGAKQNFQLEENNLYIQKILVNPGPVSKRFRARAFGRAAPIRKRTSHVLIELGIRDETEKVIGRKKFKKTGPAVRDVTAGDFKEGGGAERYQRSPGAPKRIKEPGFVRRMFRRKAI